MRAGYSADIEATLYENWPDGVRSRSMPTCAYEMSFQDMVALGSVDPGFRDDWGIGRVQEFSPAVLDWLEHSLATLSRGLFLRTSYGSFRECPLSYAVVRRVDEALAILRWVDRRILNHLRLRLAQHRPVILLARQWRDIPAQGEFRIFVSGGAIIGISQYHCHKHYPLLQQHAAEINAELRRFTRPLITALKQDRVVIDAWIDILCRHSEPELIELTPFVEQADACLFDWSRPSEFSGGLRYRSASGISEIRI